MTGGQGARSSFLPSPSVSTPPAKSPIWPIIIIVVILATVVFVGVLTIYIYNRQRKIRIYKLQRAQEEAMKLKVPPH